MGRGDGLVVSVPAFYSYDPISNPAGYLNFLYEKTKINEKEAGVGPSLKKKHLARDTQRNLLGAQFSIILVEGEPVALTIEG